MSLKQMISESQSLNGHEKAEPTFTIVSGAELLNSPIVNLPMLANGLIPKVGVSVFTGASDLGKSAWLRQLAVHLVTKEDYYCGFALRAEHNRALFVCSEDDENATATLLHKICDARYTPNQLEGLKFIFDGESLTDSIRKSLEAEQVDLVVVDCLLDFFGNKNMNQANEVRTWLNPFKRIAADFQTQIVFLHHQGKRSDEKEPNKASLLGSGAIEHAPRLVFELRAGEAPDQRYLCILKGNFLAPESKAEAHELRFENMRFVSTGMRKPIHEVVKRSVERSPEQRERLIEQVKGLAEEGKSQREISKQLEISLGSVNSYLK